MISRPPTVLLPLLLFALPAHGQDPVGFSANDTCKSAIEAEIANGSKPIESPGPTNPVMERFYGTVEFERVYNGTPARIIYLCQGTKVSGGSILAQMIYVDRASESAARSEFEQQKQQLQSRFGEPCWDPFKLSDDQRALLRGQLRSMTIWKTGPSAFTDISWDSVENVPHANWHVIISTHGPTDFSSAGEPFLSKYRLSTCEHPVPRGTPSSATK